MQYKLFYFFAKKLNKIISLRVRSAFSLSPTGDLYCVELHSPHTVRAIHKRHESPLRHSLAVIAGQVMDHMELQIS